MKGIHHLSNAIQLRAQVIGHFFARTFIFGEDVISKGFAHIKSHGDVFGRFLFQNANQFARKAVNSGSRFTAGGLPALAACAGGQGKIHAIGEGVSIN